MNVSREFLKDFAYLANRYGWTPADIEEMKEAVRANEEDGKRYITALATAHRAGYEQTRENGYVRLQAWCAANGHPDPFAKDARGEGTGNLQQVDPGNQCRPTPFINLTKKR